MFGKIIRIIYYPLTLVALYHFVNINDALWSAITGFALGLNLMLTMLSIAEII